ncbi:hypothetical protein A4A49_57233, partial [Nicotiana attenuata]
MGVFVNIIDVVMPIRLGSSGSFPMGCGLGSVVVWGVSGPFPSCLVGSSESKCVSLVKKLVVTMELGCRDIPELTLGRVVASFVRVLDRTGCGEGGDPGRGRWGVVEDRDGAGFMWISGGLGGMGEDGDAVSDGDGDAGGEF